MKQKRIVSLALVLLFILVLFSGCGGASSSDSKSAVSEQSVTSNSGGAGFQEDAAAFENTPQNTPASSGSKKLPREAKLIITANLTLETTEFAKAQAGIDTLTKKYGGYFEKASTESGSNFSGNNTKNATYTIRVPKDSFEKLLNEMGSLCHVVSKSQSAEDVGDVYVDTELRLKTQKIKQERLLVLLKKAQKMEDIITLENALSEVQYQIEQYSSELKRYDSLVDYVTINATLQEVIKLSDIGTAQSRFFPRLTTAFVKGIRFAGNALQVIVIFLAYCLPACVVLTAVGCIILFVTLKIRKVKEEKEKKQQAAKDAQPESEQKKE